MFGHGKRRLTLNFPLPKHGMSPSNTTTSVEKKIVWKQGFGFRLSHIIKLNQICSSGEKDYCYAGQCYLIKDMVSSFFLIFGLTVSWSSSILNVFLIILHKPPIHLFFLMNLASKWQSQLWKMFRLMFLQFEFGNFVSKICNGSGKIHKRGKHADDEKGKVPESLRQMNNLSVSCFL